MKSFLAIALFLTVLAPAWAKLNVVTTTTDLASLSSEVGGEFVDVSSIAKGTQDPHFIEAKPSYMIKVSRADLVIAVGLELEVGYLPSIARGARNPKILPGQPGFLETGTLIEPLEKPATRQTRAEGDVHPDGNPHFLLDPIRAGQVAVGIGERLAQLDAPHASEYRRRAAALRDRLTAKTVAWRARVKASGVRTVVTYHKTLSYFLDRFEIRGAAILEPKPGIPPTAPHIVEVTKIVRAEKVPLILVENYFDAGAANRIARDVPGLRVSAVPVAVQGAPGIETLDDLIERLVQTLEGKG